ncbi:fimbrillin family protein [Porphyromonas endodontalis]|uniref:fimbrillin family protein n=1 Tax=Porphyromonas endodontalis TaxID=28124 RepID=UPI0026F25493|nr:fimbrillin family protein [Porphyromonas endodontalis]
MKNHFFISMLAAAALLGGLTACNGKLDKAPRADQVPENAVRITASIGNPFSATRSMPLGTEEEQGKFNVGDEIFVHTSSSQRATYRFDGTVWVPKEGEYLLWKWNDDSFEAYYPAEWGEKGFNHEIYHHPTDQSSTEKIAKADLMYVTLSDQAKTKEALHFTMRRRTTRLIVEIAGFKSEFPGDAKVEKVRFHNKNDASAPLRTYIPYAKGEGKTGSTYTVLVPWDAAHNTISLEVGGKTMTAKLSRITYDSGLSYTYRLTVGKEKLETTEVTVSDWTGSAIIPGGEAKAN